jgi:hypothetical protein
VGTCSTLSRFHPRIVAAVAETDVLARIAAKATLNTVMLYPFSLLFASDGRQIFKVMGIGLIKVVNQENM